MQRCDNELHCCQSTPQNRYWCKCNTMHWQKNIHLKGISLKSLFKPLTFLCIAENKEGCQQKKFIRFHSLQDASCHFRSLKKRLPLLLLRTQLFEEFKASGTSKYNLISSYWLSQSNRNIPWLDRIIWSTRPPPLSIFMPFCKTKSRAFKILF